MGPPEKCSGPKWSTSFESCASLKNSSLLRGIPLDSAMQRFCMLFSTSTRASNLSFQSIETESLQDFISHNWVTSRTEKFLCLAIHYNLTLATFAFWGVAALFCMLTIVGVFPVYVPADSIPHSYMSSLAGQVAFFVVFFGAQDFRRMLHQVGLAGQGRLLFVDKACINQVDSELKREGIESLAGFLLASQNIVIVYGPEYLYKLWTVYELATFVMAHQDHRRITVLPTMWLRQHGVIVIGLIWAQFLYYVLFYTWRVPLTALVAYLISAVLFCEVGCYYVRQWQRQLADITAAIEAFSIRKTKCALESDRVQVQENVRTFLLCLGRINEESAENALDEFDKLVREVLPRALVASVGPTGTPYSHLIAWTSLFMGSALDTIAARTRAGAPLSGTIAAAVFHASGCLTFLPLGIFLVQKILARRLDLRGCVDRLFIAAAPVPAMVLYFIGFVLQFMAGEKAVQQAGRAWAYCAAVLIYCALAALVTVLVYVNVPGQRTTNSRHHLFSDGRTATSTGGTGVANTGVAAAPPTTTTALPTMTDALCGPNRRTNRPECLLCDRPAEVADTEVTLTPPTPETPQSAQEGRDKRPSLSLVDTGQTAEVEEVSELQLSL